MALRNTAMKLVTCFLCLVCLTGCQHGTDSEDSRTTTTESETEMTQAKETVESIVVDDLLECIDMLGKTATEIGIAREAIDTEHSFYIATYFDGNIFGVKGYADLLFDDVSDSNDDYLAKQLLIFTKEINYDECKIRLAEKFGDPLGETSIPYAQVNYGALKWTDYRFKDIAIELSTASELKHIQIQIEKKTD